MLAAGEGRGNNSYALRYTLAHAKLSFIAFLSLAPASRVSLYRARFSSVHTRTINPPPRSFSPVSSLMCDGLIGPIGAARDREDGRNPSAAGVSLIIPLKRKMKEPLYGD